MNGYSIQQSTASQPLVFLMIDSADHVTGKTGLTPTVTISKNGSSFASPAGAVSEIGNGLYAVAANATDSNTLGPLVLHATAFGADPVDWLYPVVAYDPLAVAVGANTVAPANSTIASIYALAQLTDADVALIKSAMDALSAMLPNTDYLAGSATDDGYAELDSAYRVKLAADQPDYAPATVSALSDLQTDVDANTGYLTSLTSSMSTLLGRVTSNVYTMWTDLIAMITNSGVNPKFTTTALSNAPTGSGGSGGGNAPTIVTLQAVAGISPGVIVGPSEPLVIGDDYLTTLGRSIRVNLLDENGDPAEVEFGDYALDDDGISIQLLLAKSGKPSTIANLVGTCTFFPAEEVDSVLIPPYLIVEFTRTETAKAIPGAYDMQAEAVWEDGKVVTFAPYGQLSFVRNIRRS